jgi:arsenate reductase-like glutaredoxin family protein
MLYRQKFHLLCSKCSNESEKTGRWLKNHPHPLCAQCGVDLSPRRDELVQIIQACEKTLAEDLARVKGKWQSNQ